MRQAFAPAALVSLCLLGCGPPAPAKQASVPAYTAGKFDPEDPAYKQRVQARLDAMKKDEAIREEAPWFGTTGLPDDTEREVPRYLRREFGQALSQPGALQARDLVYVGAFVQGTKTTRFWRIQDGAPEAHFAYVVSGPEGRQLTGWGDRSPPK